MVDDSKVHLSKSVFDVSKMVLKECKTEILIKEIDISRLMTHSQWIEKEKLMESVRDNERERLDSVIYSCKKSGGGS